jgi:hypothetical protein
LGLNAILFATLSLGLAWPPLLALAARLEAKQAPSCGSLVEAEANMDFH